MTFVMLNVCVSLDPCTQNRAMRREIKAPDKLPMDSFTNLLAL